MPIPLTETQPPPMPPAPPRKKWSRKECAALELSGVLDQERLELIEGELISKMGKKRPHVNALALLVNWLVQTFGFEFVNFEAPIDVSPEDNPTNEPEPDAIVLKRKLSEFLANPQPDDLHLAIEVADSSLNFDRTTKALLYARAGIQEYWILDVIGRQLLVHRDPRFGRYENIAVCGMGEAVSPLAAPNAEFRVDAAFSTGSQARE